MNVYKIYLIEDCKKHAHETLVKLREVAPDYNNDKFTFEFELIEGSVSSEYEKNKYLFYEKKDIFKKINKRIKDIQKGDKMGLLLDVLLTQEDMEQTMASYYPRASISRDIFFKFSDVIPIYIITATSAFGGQSDIIMGTNLSEQYINQQRLIRDSKDTIKEELGRLFAYYLDYENSSTVRNK